VDAEGTPEAAWALPPGAAVRTAPAPTEEGSAALEAEEEDPGGRPREFYISIPRRLDPAARTRRSLSLMLAAGGAFMPTDEPVGSFRFGAEWGFREPWAVSLDGGLQSNRGATQGGTVRVSLQWATLSVRRSFLAQGLNGLHATLGAQLIRLEATAEGFNSQGTHADVFTGGAAASVEWRETFGSPMFVLLRAGAHVRWPQTFSVGGLGTVLTVPSGGIGLEAGVGWNFL
jgi:hypothetical protein